MVGGVYMPATALGTILVHLEALEARVAELTRPKAPEDFGLVGVHLTPIERRIVLALLPPGERIHRDALVRTVWPDVAAAGLATAGLVRTNLSRVRLALSPIGWRIPRTYGHAEHVLLGPDDPLPAGYRECPGASERHASADRRRACPECDGWKSHSSPRCRACYKRRRAARAITCPACGGPKSAERKVRLCRACNTARRRGLLAGWAAA
jgi:hypothetical protein